MLKDVLYLWHRAIEQKKDTDTRSADFLFLTSVAHCTLTHRDIHQFVQLSA